MASMMALPREGHLKPVFQMFLSLKSKYTGVAVFDPTEPDVKLNQFTNEDWSTIPCVICKEDLSSIALPSRGTCFTMRSFVGSVHAGYSINLRSRTVFIAFFNNAPIFVYS